MSENITLPLELTNGLLTLEEIGAIFVLFGLPQMEEERKAQWTDDDYLARILQSMLDNKLIDYTTDNGNLLINLNINENTIDFEWKTDYDLDKNIIYQLCDIHSDDKYTVRPKLTDNKLYWHVSHSTISSIDEAFDDLEDAKKFTEVHRTENNE